MLRWLVALVVVLIGEGAYAAKTRESIEKVLGERSQLAVEQKEILQKIKGFEDALKNIEIAQAEKATAIQGLQSEIQTKLPLLVRLGRTHPFQLLLNPSTGKDSLKAFVLVRTLTTSMKAQISQLEVELKGMNELSLNLRAQKEKQEQLLKQLEQKMAKLQAIENEKQALLKNKKKVDELLADEEDVNVLLEESRALLAGSAKKTAKLKNLPFSRLERPLSGKIIQDASLQAKFSPQSVGLIFEAKKGEAVVSPATGKVVFKGPFRGQKEIIIIDHGKKCHSVLMGMDNISADIGQIVYTGEKLGKMVTYGNKPPKLYYELRVDGKAIDPEPYVN